MFTLKYVDGIGIDGQFKTREEAETAAREASSRTSVSGNRYGCTRCVECIAVNIFWREQPWDKPTRVGFVDASWSEPLAN